MTTFATYFQNDKEKPLVYGEINLINPPRRRLRLEDEKTGVPVRTVFAGFCGTDFELMQMARRGEMTPKFPSGEKRLINGHEGVVWVPGENRFAIVLIRGGNSYDPTRFTEEEDYFEYGCDGADGLFSDFNYYNPDMLLHLPPAYENLQKIPLSLAKKLVFCDPYACAVFQRERMEDIGAAQNFRVLMAQNDCGEAEAMKLAVAATFKRVVIFGLGTTGLFIGDQIRRSYPEAAILFVGRSAPDSEKVRFALREVRADYFCCDNMSEEETARGICREIGGKASVFVGTSGAEVEHRIAFKHEVLGCNGIYNSFSLGPKVQFDTMPFGFKNHVIMSSINFTRAHMEKAIEILCESRFDEIVSLIDKETFISDPIYAYENLIYSKGSPTKTAVIWDNEYLDNIL